MAAKAKQTAVPGGVPGMALSILLALLACSCEKSQTIGGASSDDIVFRSVVPAVTIATSIGAHENDLWLVPGAYSLDLEWTATKGDYAERFIGRSVEVTIAAGEVSQLRIGLRGSGATDIAFDISVASRGLRTIDIDDVLAHTGVDLGIRTEEGKRLLFANENVGAEGDVDPGDFFAFGETSRQYDAVDGAMVGGANDLTFSWSSTPYWVSGSGTSSRWSRYTADKDGYAATGLSDSLSVLLPEDDVARRQWGGNWRLPTREEWRKLIDSCSWEWLDNYCGSGVPGYVVHGAGAAIFLPAAGYCEKSYASPSTPTLYYENLQGCYWSSSVYERIPAMAQSLHFAEDAYLVGYDDRCLGATVRAVCEVD